MSDRNLIHQLQELHTLRRAPALWREQAREQLLNVTATQTQREFTFGESFRLQLANVRLSLAPLPLVPVTVAVLAVVFAWAPLANALQTSGPGSFWYPMKRSVERVELALQATPESQGLYHLTLASRRLDEVGSVTPSSLVTQASLLKDYNVDLGFAEAALQATQPTSSLALQYDEEVERLFHGLARVHPETAAQVPYGIAVALTDKLSSQAVAFLVAAHQSGANGVLPAAVATRLESQITKVEAKLDGVDSKLATFPESKPSPRVVLEARQTIVPVQVATLEAKKTLTEARDLVQKKEFSLALQKVQESEDITVKSEAAVDKAEAPATEPGQVQGATDQNTAPAVTPDTTSGGAGANVPTTIPDTTTPNTNQPTPQ